MVSKQDFGNLSETPTSVLSVSELTREAKTLLESHFDHVRVEGEIGDFTAASSGHWYFTIKDSSAQIRCAMFKGANSRLRFRPKRGDIVVLRAQVSLYQARGEFQLIVQHMSAAGDGALQLAFEQLKAKLLAEGLFAAERKRPLPTFAHRIGVVTSASGAAFHDIVSVLGRRSPMIEVVLLPVPVQGGDAPQAIIEAIETANRLNTEGKLLFDVLIVGRGGGSLEDLWAFNDEQLARAIADSNLPIISAVGHEIDFSIADFVADHRAATPSAAAELASFDQSEWLQRFDSAQLALYSGVRRRVRTSKIELNQLAARLRHPGTKLQQQRAELIRCQRQLTRLITMRVLAENQTLVQLSHRLQRQHPGRKVEEGKQYLDRHHNELIKAMRRRLLSIRQHLSEQQRLLNTLGPEQILERGYAIVHTEAGTLLRSHSDTQPGDRLSIRLREGSVVSEVQSVQPPDDSSTD